MIILASIFLFYKSNDIIITEILTVEIIDTTREVLVVKNNKGVNFELKANKNYIKSIVPEKQYKITYNYNKLLFDQTLKIKSIKKVNEI